MARNDNAVMTAPYGYIHLAPVGTAAPTEAEVNAFDPAVGYAGWEELGHTSRDDLPEFGFDGGDVETKGSWQNEALRTVQKDPAVDSVLINALQLDTQGLSLYYGIVNPATAPAGTVVVNDTSGQTERALLVTVRDGDERIAFHARRASFRRDDAPSLAVDEFTALPIRATILRDGANELFNWVGVQDAVAPAA